MNHATLSRTLQEIKHYILVETTGFSVAYVVPAEKKTRTNLNQRTNGPVNSHLINWPCNAQNIQNLENIW